MKFPAFLLLFVMAGCSTGRVVKTEKAEGVNFQNFKTFDFYKLEASGDTSSSKFAAYTGILREAIARELTAKGYNESGGNPDLLVNIGIVVKEEIQTRETNIREAPRYIGQRRYSWKSQEVPVGRYKSGTVTIDLVESKKNNMVWQGVLEGIIAERQKGYESDVNKAVADLFAKFPD
ncbi:MAG TPA: DUF4136 domain-containing protein [Flavitalea sp.]|nr:DUF4136 domain-containing protein [Flavitalea sp.]